MQKHNLSKEEVQALIASKIKAADETIDAIAKERAELKRQIKIKRESAQVGGILILCLIAAIMYMTMCK